MRCRSVLQAFEGIMEVLGTAGDAELGGNDFDARLADWLEAECAARGLAAPDHGARFAHEGQPHGWALEAAEAAKVALSRSETAQVALPGGAALTLSRPQFEELSSELFQRMANVLEALGDALFIEWVVRPFDAVPGRPPSSGGSGSSGGGQQQEGQQQQGRQQDRWAPPPRRITQVALVGQLTRLPSVQQFVARCTGGGVAGLLLHGCVDCVAARAPPITLECTCPPWEQPPRQPGAVAAAANKGIASPAAPSSCLQGCSRA